MDSGKLRALTNFVNAVNIGPCIESLKQLHDGSHFVNMMKIINGSQSHLDSEHPIQRYRAILNFLEDFFSTQLKFHVDCSRIVNTADETELAKVASLMLCASVQGGEGKAKLFVEPITRLDLASQNEIKDIIEFVLDMQGSSGNQLRRNFADVLHRRGDSTSSDSSLGSLNDSGSLAKTPRVEAPCPFQKVYQASPLSPVKMLLTSPHMANKINLRKMYQKIRELETKNASERALKDDLESEVAEKNKKIVDLDSRLRDLNNRLQGAKGLQDKLDEFQAREGEFNKETLQLQKMKLKLSELSGTKEENSRLDKEVKDLASERTKLHASLSGHQRLKAEHDDVHKSLRQSQREVAEMKAAAARLGEDLEAADGRCAEVQQMMQQSQQIYREKIERLEEEISSKDTSPVLGESLGMITEKRIADLEAELNELRSTWIEPKVGLALRDELSRMSQLKVGFEESFEDTKALLVKSENEGGHLRNEVEGKTETIRTLTDVREALAHKVTELQTALEEGQDEIRRTEHSAATLEERLEEASDEKRKLEGYLKDAESGLARQLQEFRARQSAWEAQRVAHEDGERKLKDQHRELENEIADRRRELETVSSGLKGKLTVSRSKVKSLEALLEQERWAGNEKLSALRTELATNRKESELATRDLQGRLEGSQHLLAAARSALEKAKSDMEAETRDKECEMERSAAERRALEGSVTSEREAARSLQESHLLESRSWEKIRQELKGGIGKLKEDQSREKVSFQEKTMSLESEVSTLRVELERALSAREALRASSEAQREELSGERAKAVHEMERKLAELTEQLQESGEDVVRARSESSSLREGFARRAAEAKEENERREATLTRSRDEEVAKFETVREELKRRLEQSQAGQREERGLFEERIADLESKNSSVNVDLERAKQENSVLHASLVSDKQEMFTERGRLAKEMEAREDDLRNELREVKQSLGRAHSEAAARQESVEKDIAELREESGEKEKGLRAAHQSEVERLKQVSKGLENQMEQQASARNHEQKLSEETGCKLQSKIDSLSEDLERERSEKESLHQGLSLSKREMSDVLEKANRESQGREDQLREALLATKQALSEARSEAEIQGGDRQAREAELMEEMERKERNRQAKEEEEETSRKLRAEREVSMAGEIERLRSEVKRAGSIVSKRDRAMKEENDRLKSERDQWKITRERLEEEARHSSSVVEVQEGKIGGLEASLEEASLEKKQLNLDLLHLKEDSALRVLQREEAISKLDVDLKAARGELQRSDEEYGTKLGRMTAAAEDSQRREKAAAELSAEGRRALEADLEKTRKERHESEKKLQERVTASVKQVGELTANLREATAIAEENRRGLDGALAEKVELETKLFEVGNAVEERVSELEGNVGEQKRAFEEERTKLHVENEALRARLMALEQEQLRQSSGECQVEQSTRVKEVEILQLEKQLLEEKRAAQERQVEVMNLERQGLVEQQSARSKEFDTLASEKQLLVEQQAAHGSEVEALKVEKQQLVERMNKLIEMNRRFKESEKREVKEKNEDLQKYKKGAEQEIEEMRQRYEREIEISDRRQDGKQNLLQQELDTVTSELEHTKLMLSYETEALREKSNLVTSASESLKSSKKETEKEMSSLRRATEKEKKENKKRLEKLEQELLSVKTESCSLQRKVEEDAQKEMTEAKQKMAAERMEFQSKIQTLADENEILRSQAKRLDRTAEPVRRFDLEHSSLELSNADLHSSRRSGSGSDLQADSLAEGESDVSAADSLNGTPSQRLGRNLSEMRLDDLEVSPRASAPSSRGSPMSLRSNASTRPKGRTAPSVAPTEPEDDLAGSTAADDQTTYNLRSSTSSQLNLPDRVAKTLDELCTSQNSLTASTMQEKSHHTTGRANFVIVNDCDEEPEFFAWEDRIQELHRRNVLCRPHMKTSYPVETQTYAPDSFDGDADKKVKETTFSADAGETTTTTVSSGRPSRKRKTGLAQIDEVPGGKQLRKSASRDVPTAGDDVTPDFLRKAVSSHQHMPPPDLPPPDIHHAETARASRAAPPPGDLPEGRKLVASNTNSTGRLLRSSDIRTNGENKPQHTLPDQESLTFDIGFSPKPSLRRRSMRHSLAKRALGRNSPKVNTELAAARKEHKSKSKKESGKTPKRNNPGEDSSRSKLPTGLPTTAKKSKRRSIGKWLGK